MLQLKFGAAEAAEPHCEAQCEHTRHSRVASYERRTQTRNQVRVQEPQHRRFQWRAWLRTAPWQVTEPWLRGASRRMWLRRLHASKRHLIIKLYATTGVERKLQSGFHDDSMMVPAPAAAASCAPRRPRTTDPAAEHLLVKLRQLR